MTSNINNTSNKINASLDKNTEYLEQLQKMFSEIKQCLNGGSFGIQCAAEITNKYIRKLSFMKNLIYPWRNYDWDYTEFVKKNYNTKLLGASGDGTIGAIVHDVDAILKIIEGLLFDANPADNSAASNPSSSKNDLVDCLNQSGGLSCRILNAAKISSLNQKKPYDSKFFNKKIDGQHSSSYFVQVGMCPSKITDKSMCESKGFNWIPNPLAELPEMLRGPDTKPGSCYKGRYAYINNKPGYKIGQIEDMNGLIPSLINDMVDISPDKIMAVAMGQGVSGLDLQKCDEGFISRYNNNTFHYILVILVITLCIIFPIIILSLLLK